ncbi:General transcription factor 3C polypeptide 3 [Fasciola hepatica]|uniref:General transcription factor 3C polypeptide 3 n=1 Tax=Fasciola hepatica TaxID=6192 RepID=A0A4E0RAP6_FASHE|nr:General transcription factor 3C polypeptide 3 [Fasciola hepatica]
MCVLYCIAEVALVEDGCSTLSAPQASEPYTVLAEVYYRRGDHNKAKELLQSAAERCPNDSNLWLSLVEIAEEKNDLALALYYTRQAVRGDRQDASIRQRLIAYLERAGRRREALNHRLFGLSLTPESTGPEQFRVARNLADEFFKLMDMNCAIRAYEAAFEKFPKSGTESDKNTVVTMMVQGEKNIKALQFFVSYCDVSLIKANRKRLSPDSITGSRSQVKLYTRCTYPRTLSTELTVKLFLVLVRLQFTTAITPHVLKRFTSDLAKKHYDWLLDIVKTYRKIGMNSTALQLLTRLSTFETTKTIPLIWTMLAECQVEAGQIEDALDAYRHVIQDLAPRHAEARLAYGNLLKRVGKDKEALAALHPSSVMETTSRGQKARKVRFAKPGETTIATGTALTKEASTTRRKIDTRADFDMDTETEWDEEDAEVEDEDDEEGTSSRAQARADAEWLATSNAIPDAALLAHDPIAYRLAFERCRMLDQPDTVDSFLDETWTLLFSDVARLCGPKWAQFTRFLESMRLRNRLMERLSADSTAAGSDTNTPSTAAERNVSGFDIWGLFLRLIDVLQSRLPRSLSFLESATAWACLLPQIHSEDGRRQAASNLLISACLLGGHGSPALIKLRELRTQYGQSNQFWNTMNIAITLSRDLRHSRFVDRVFMKESSNYAAAILANNDRIVRGSYRYATGRLIEMRQVNPNDPLVHLLLSIGFLGIALQKHVASRHPAVLQALGFISEYRRLRGHCQEVYYNIARLCHQLLLNHVAIAYYEKVLQTEPVGNTETEKAYTDLRPEAAFNLILLYRSQGNHAMAHYLMQKHLVI